jgi:hypothetical protein
MASVAELQRALDGGDDSSLDRALRDVEEAAREHGLALDPVSGKVVDVDRPLIPSPGLARHAAWLRQDLGELVGEAAVLRSRLATAAATPAERERLRQQARALLDALERFGEEEVRLIQESVNTDIGAGD